MRALQLSTGKTAAEIEKMLEQGQLTAEYIKPFINAMGELASANGAYEKALKKLGTVENRMKTTAGLAAARIGETGFTRGLIKLYEELSGVLSENDHALREVGKAYNVIFRGIAKLIRMLEPWVAATARAFGSLARAIEWLHSVVSIKLLGSIAAASAAMLILTGRAKLLGRAMAFAFALPLAKLVAIVAVMDEIRAFFDANVIGLFDDPNATPEERAKVAFERKQFFGIAGKAEQDKYLTEQQKTDLAARSQMIGRELTTEDKLRVAQREVDVLRAQSQGGLLDRLSFNLSKWTGNQYANAIASGQNPTTSITVINQIDGQEVSRHTSKHATNQIMQGLQQSMPAGGM